MNFVIPEYQECGIEDFKCANQKCVPMFYVCDGDDDCRDGSDEKFCDTFCANATATGLATPPFCNNLCPNIKDKVCTVRTSSALC